MVIIPPPPPHPPPAINQLLDVVDSSSMHPSANQVRVIELLEAHFAEHGSAQLEADQVALQWDDDQPAFVIPTNHTQQRRRLMLHGTPPAAPAKSTFQDALQNTLQPLLSINKDKVLEVDIDAEYNKVLQPYKKPPIKISKKSLLDKVCQAPFVTPSKRIPTRCVGPSAILNLVPAECTISYTPANKTRTYRCQAPRLVLVKNPAFCNKQYKSPATFRGFVVFMEGVLVYLCTPAHPITTGPVCVLRKQLGNVTTFSINSGVIRFDLSVAKDYLTTNALRALSSLTGGEDDVLDNPSILNGLREQLGALANGDVLPSLRALMTDKDGLVQKFISTLSTVAVRSLVGEALSTGKSLAAAMLGRVLSG